MIGHTGIDEWQRDLAKKRKDSRYVSGRSPHWMKMKNPECEAVRREADIGIEELTEEELADLRQRCKERANTAVARAQGKADEAEARAQHR